MVSNPETFFTAAFSKFDELPTPEQEPVLDSLMGHISAAPFDSLAALDGLRTPERENHEAYKVARAIALFATGMLDKAEALVRAAFEDGCRRGILFELLVRILSETDRADEAIAILETDRQTVVDRPQLIKRLAALHYINENYEDASRYCRIVRSWCSDELLQTVRRSNAEMERLILESGEDLGRDAIAALNPYQGDEFQKKSWLEYAEEINSNLGRYQASVPYLNALFQEHVERILGELDDVRLVINFGSLFGFSEYALARRRPDVDVVGYDYSPVAKQLNDQVFSSPNLYYLTGSFREQVAALTDGRRSLLCHIRTGTLMSPLELTDLYDQCRELGVAAILLFEDVNFNLNRAEYPDFSRSNQKTALMGGVLMNHDYPYFLEKSGYRMARRWRRLYPLNFGETINADSMVTEIIDARREE